MGREWGYWSRSMRKERESPGCMSGVLHFFDFYAKTHHCSTTVSSSQDLFQEPATLQGLEAPKNSLEISSDLVELSIAEAMEEEIPIGIQLIYEQTTASAPRLKGSKNEEPLDQKRTPNLVARLMGLDLLPDYESTCNRNSDASEYGKNYSKNSDFHHHNGSQSFSSTPRCSLDKSQGKHLKEFQTCRALRTRNTNVQIEGRTETVKSCRSLLDTPRLSSARRSSEEDPRFFQQINKENMGYLGGSKSSYRSGQTEPYLVLEIPSSPSSGKAAFEKPQRGWNKNGRSSCSKENKGAGDYAREIVTQVKVSASKKAGSEVGNTNTNDDLESARRGNTSNRSPRNLTKPANELGESRNSTPSCSPRLRFLNKPSSTLQNQTSSSPKSLPKPLSSTPTLPNQQPRNSKIIRSQLTMKRKQKCERFNSKHKKPNLTKVETTPTLKEDPFVYVPTTKITKPLSNNLLNAVPVNKETHSKPCYLGQSHHGLREAATISSTSSNFSCWSNQHLLNNHESLAQFMYVRNILECTGIYSSTCVSFTKWYSPSHPLDPTIFHRLEETHYASTCSSDEEQQKLQGSKRMLLFQFVDEILVELLKPYLNMKPWAFPSSSHRKQKQKHLTGKQLLEQLCLHIQTFPSVNCQFLGDIDGLVERDFGGFSDVTASLENEIIVFEIEREITDTLLHEEALSLSLSKVGVECMTPWIQIRREALQL